jgi:hypothetical protein
MSEPLSEEELAELEARTAAATPGPWAAHIEAEVPIGGESMIGLDGLPGDFPPDMYVRHDNETAPPADIKFIAPARNYVPRLLAEVRRLRGIPELAQSCRPSLEPGPSAADSCDMLVDTSEGKYHVGERWHYRTRVGEEDSLLTVLKVELSQALGVIVHVRLDGLRIENPRAPGGVSETIGHMPFSEASIDSSVTTRAAMDASVTADDGGYDEWRRASDAGHAGVFTISVAEGVDLAAVALSH